MGSIHASLTVITSAAGFAKVIEMSRQSVAIFYLGYSGILFTSYHRSCYATDAASVERWLTRQPIIKGRNNAGMKTIFCKSLSSIPSCMLQGTNENLNTPLIN